MRKEVIFGVFLFGIIILSACEKIDVSKLTDKDLQRISKELIVCNKPYIRYASGCCLDKNDNSICDKDEQEKVTKTSSEIPLVEETPSGITPPVKETPAQPNKPETFQEQCTLQAGISCLDFKVTSSSSTITIKNSLGYDITIDRIIANQCTALGNQGLFLNGNSATYTLTCINSGSRYNGQVNISYTNPETGIQHTNIGQIMAKISGELLPDVNPPIKETTTSSEQTQESQDKCTLQAGLSCLDYQVTLSHIVIKLSNGLGRTILSTTFSAEGCGTLSSTYELGSGSSATFTIVCNPQLSGTKYDGKLIFTYTEKDTQLTKTVTGQLTAKITG